MAKFRLREGEVVEWREEVQTPYKGLLRNGVLVITDRRVVLTVSWRPSFFMMGWLTILMSTLHVGSEAAFQIARGELEDVKFDQLGHLELAATGSLYATERFSVVATNGVDLGRRLMAWKQTAAG